MTTTENLIRHGMFPKELPPNFSTAGYADALTRATGLSSFPAAKTKKLWSYLCSHSLARSSGVRRILGIPNPITQWHLASVISSNWTHISSLMSPSIYSLSRPSLNPRNRRAVGPERSGDALALERARVRSSGRYLVRADIAEFYRTVYSHAIPWSVYGKEEGKRRFREKEKKAWPEHLDAAVGSTVHGQTNGIPIGPDTSFIIGEILLSSIDKKILSNLPRVKWFRFYDDFEFACNSQREAEDVSVFIQNALEEIDLLLNPGKTKLLALPQRISQGTEWMRDFPPPQQQLHPLFSDFTERAPLSPVLIIDFFERAFESAQSHPDLSVVGFAMSRIPKITDWTDSSWALVQDLMAQGAMIDTGAMHQYIRALVRISAEKNRFPDRDKLSETLNCLIQNHAPRGHSSEVSWCIWAALCFGLPLVSESVVAISKLHDDVVAILALQAQKRGILESALDTQIWEQWMIEHQLYGEHWLCAYEALVQGWLEPKGGSDYIGADPGFSWLQSNRVRFVEEVVSPSRKVLEEFRPIRGDYEEDEEEAEEDDAEEEEAEEDEAEEDEAEEDEVEKDEDEEGTG